MTRKSFVLTNDFFLYVFVNKLHDFFKVKKNAVNKKTKTNCKPLTKKNSHVMIIMSKLIKEEKIMDKMQMS